MSAFRHAAALLAFAFAATAAAGPASEVTLAKAAVKLDAKTADDEGILVLVTDGNQGIKKLRIVSEDGTTAFETENAGNDLWLHAYRLRAGRYLFETLELSGGRTLKWKPEDPATPRFEIVAGAFNYPGDFYFKLRQDGIKTRLYGQNLDLLMLLGSKSSPKAFPKGDKVGPFASRPFVVTGQLAKTLLPALKMPPKPEWVLKDWVVAAGLPADADQLALVNKLLAKADIKPLELGKTRKEVAELLKELPESDGRFYGGNYGDEFLFFEGLYGEDGLHPIARLHYGDGDKLEIVFLRATDGWAVQRTPDRATWDDINGYADSKSD